MISNTFSMLSRWVRSQSRGNLGKYGCLGLNLLILELNSGQIVHFESELHSKGGLHLEDKLDLEGEFRG